ncbi:MAG: DUF3857 domain-containing protein [Alphaproteobacteria bacterium]|nr:DUF3857 domain-containing protein [Alphaproteobacteria bacterium]
MGTWLVLGMLATASAAHAQNATLKYGPPPAWVAPPPALAARAPSPGEPLQVLLWDEQARLEPAGETTFYESKAKILTPSGLELGNLAFLWDPQTESLTVNRVTLTRGGRVIDVLADNKFTILRREQNLEQATLDGSLTATLQIKGLQVGDVLDIAVTRTHHDPLLAGHPVLASRLPNEAVDGAVRLRVTWPKGEAVRWRTTPDLAKPTLSADSLVYRFDGLGPVTPTDGAPAHYNWRRSVELSGFARWSDVSALSAPLYAAAEKLAPDSPLKAQADKIRAATADPAQRMLNALELVQNQIRYVYVGLNSGAYHPAPADKTWARRFGDCKGKTVLLLALLHQLGIQAEPVLANIGGGDGVDQQLPSLGAFDHVLVRASVAGKTYWLDGTRMGDTQLAALEIYPYGWDLPVRAHGAELEHQDRPALSRASDDVTMQVDASAGLDVPAKVHVDMLIRGDLAYAGQQLLAALPPQQATQVLKDDFAKQYDWLQASKVAWSYDPAHRTLLETVDAAGRMDWQADTEGRPIHWFEVEDGQFGRLKPIRRPKEQDQSAPYARSFPFYNRWATTVTLPKGVDFGIDAPDIRVQWGGYELERRTRIVGRTVVMYRSGRGLTPQISAAEAAQSEATRLAFHPRAVFIRADDKPAKPAAAPLLPSPKPEDAEGLLKAAYMAVATHAADQALAYADQALAARPGWDKALTLRAALLATEGRYAQAADAYAAALAASRPAPERLMLARVEVLQAGGQSDEALRQVAQVLAAYPKSAAGYVQRGQLYLAAHETGKALADAETAHELAPGDSLPLRLRAAIFWDMGRKADALAADRAAVAAQPDLPLNLTAYADALDRAGRTADARDAMHEALLMDPLNLETLSRAAFLDSRHHDYDAAIGRLDAALALAPGQPMLLNERCWTRALADKDLPAAAKDCDAAIALRKDYAEAMDSRAFVSFREGRYADAVARYTRVLALKPDLAPSLFARGLARLRSGDIAGGRADLAAATKLDPKAGDIYAEVGLHP